MADRLWRAQVTIPLDSGIPEDAIVNTWYFDDDDDPIAGPEDTAGWINDLLSTFYGDIGTSLFANTVDASADAALKIYDMADPEPRVPVYTGSVNITQTGSDPLPNEVALCLSFAADVPSGVNPQRRRGRIFLGPIAQSAAVKVGSQLRPHPDVMAQVAASAGGLRDGFLHPGSPGYRLHWSIFSPATLAGGGSLGAAFNDVESGWVDDAFDTQRRRGAVPTTRQSF